MLYLRTNIEIQSSFMNDLKHLFLFIVSPGKTWQKMDKVPYATQIF